MSMTGGVGGPFQLVEVVRTATTAVANVDDRSPADAMTANFGPDAAVGRTHGCVVLGDRADRFETPIAVTWDHDRPIMVPPTTVT